VISFDEALARVLGGAAPVGAERVALEAASGRVLAEDVAAPAPMPPFDYSAMDGWAIATADVEGVGPWTLPARGESAAGRDLPAFTRGTTCRIFTGARLPDGCDAVVMQEIVERDGDRVTLRERPKPGAHVRRRGEDLREGAVALRRGTRLGPGHVALAAALDRATLAVSRRPVVAIVATGDELRSPGEPARPGSVVESNAFFVAAAARAAGADARVTPFARDDPAAARAALAEAIRGVDLLVTIGGVSVGDHDVVRPALEAAGVTIEFFRVALRPGKPLVVGRAGATQVLGLPGNPASASLTFLLFGVPLLRALAGDAAPLPATRRVAVALDKPLVRGEGDQRRQFLRARLEDGGARARVLPNQASGAVTSFAEADALVVFHEGTARLDDGDAAFAIRLDDV
jgi:molybdopterin molybdotransferase